MGSSCGWHCQWLYWPRAARGGEHNGGSNAIPRDPLCEEKLWTGTSTIELTNLQTRAHYMVPSIAYDENDEKDTSRAEQGKKCENVKHYFQVAALPR
eukprot:4402834-Amphidinium_carterae.1